MQPQSSIEADSKDLLKNLNVNRGMKSKYKYANYIVLDTETGGLHPDKNPMCSIALITLDPVKLVKINEFETIIKPYNDLALTEGAEKVHGLKLADLNKGMDIKKLVNFLVLYFKDASHGNGELGKPIIIAHNTPFDLGFIAYAFALEGLNLYDHINKNTVDTLMLAKMMWQGQTTDGIDKINLGVCCERMGVTLKGAHGAMPDTVACMEIFIKFTQKLRYGTLNDKEIQSTVKEVRTRDHFQF